MAGDGSCKAVDVESATVQDEERSLLSYLILNSARMSVISSPQKAGRVVHASLTEYAAIHCRYIDVLDFFDLILLQGPDVFHPTRRRTVSSKTRVPMLWRYL